MDSQKTEVGYVLSIQDYLAYLDGLPGVHINDLVENEQGIRGVVSTLFEDKVEIWILDEGLTYPGQLFKKIDKSLSVNTGDFLLGRAVNSIGMPIDGKGPISKTRGIDLELDQPAPPMQARQFIDTQFISGMTAIDTLIPLGKGQRQLVLGDPHSGKTPFLVDLIVNQTKTGTICIYTAIGKPITAVRSMIDLLTETGALKHTVIIAASSTDSPPQIFYTPYSAMSVAEFFQKQGKDVLIILDDMGIHAKVYRELSLLGGKNPGRESYPGDIFYTHAKLLERAGKFNKTAGGGSITALPIIEIATDDFTTFIPTNLMAMTDGHFIFKADLFAQGFRPAVDIALSVSRVGRQTQIRLQNLLSALIRQILAEASSFETLSRFSGELPPQTQIKLREKAMIDEIIKQEALTFISPFVQTAFLGLIFTSFLKDKNGFFIQKNKQKILRFLSDPRLKNFTREAATFKNLDQFIAKLELLVPGLKEVCR
ncbi:MAG: F-type H+-transporting ATPase subunit alpha [Microgenomates group bacterium Gr01-1014_93]|nr:MAG: F-type H+-transporting ATPase subunit alpha [Microgenomates group bacterium Gr01-1014_93]